MSVENLNTDVYESSDTMSSLQLELTDSNTFSPP